MCIRDSFRTWPVAGLTEEMDMSAPVHAHVAPFEHVEEELGWNRGLGAENSGRPNRPAREKLSGDRERHARVERASGDFPVRVREDDHLGPPAYGRAVPSSLELHAQCVAVLRLARRNSLAGRQLEEHLPR